MSSSDAIRTRRLAANLTQEEVAAALGVSHGAVSQWENGRITPRRAVAIRLDDLLGAEGALTAELGYADLRPQRTHRADEIADLKKRVGELEEQVRSLLRAQVPLMADALRDAEHEQRRARGAKRAAQ